LHGPLLAGSAAIPISFREGSVSGGDAVDVLVPEPEGVAGRVGADVRIVLEAAVVVGVVEDLVQDVPQCDRVALRAAAAGCLSGDCRLDAAQLGFCVLVRGVAA
jgi:hypothetical protein